ncbi:uncharacterized protein [Watersipora subatra]|uniref:uncharacterized protein isoform X2 n=1 Tax=Watersipora subatra TaxID=2589382 RepID=UPI00355C4EF8
MGKIYRQMRNRGDQMSLDIDMLRDKAGPIYEYLSQLRKQVRQSRVSAADCKLNKKVSLRLASSALQDGVKEMYSALHESEHRLLHVRAKGDCESHISACNERQQLEKSLKVPRHDKSDMTAKKPVWLDDEYMNNAVRSKLPMFSRIKEAAWHTARLNALKNEKKAFFKKICCIISVLGYIKQMKQPTANPTPLSPETMKKYKHTIDILTSDVLHHARLTDGLVSKRPTISKSFTTQRRPTVFKKPATSVLRETVAARRSTLQLNKDDLASNLTANSLRSPGNGWQA